MPRCPDVSERWESGILICGGQAVGYLFLSFLLLFAPCRLSPAAAPPQTRLPTQQALPWAHLAMAPPAHRIQASPAVDRIPHLPLANSPRSPPKEPPTHLGAARPTLRTLPTPAGAGSPGFWQSSAGKKKAWGVLRRELGRWIICPLLCRFSPVLRDSSLQSEPSSV